MNRSDLLVPFRTFAFLQLGLLSIASMINFLRADSTDFLQIGWGLQVAHMLGLVICLTVPRIKLLLGRFYLPVVLAFAGGGVLVIELWRAMAGSSGGIDSSVALTRSLNRVFVMVAAVAIMVAWHYRLRTAMLFLAA